MSSTRGRVAIRSLDSRWRHWPQDSCILFYFYSFKAVAEITQKKYYFQHHRPQHLRRHDPSIAFVAAHQASPPLTLDKSLSSALQTFEGRSTLRKAQSFRARRQSDFSCDLARDSSN
ncbi:hypothetical protein I7I50_08645 [Histoplasma capsulatum G186AR]|uniref:Uncharacterized protein n=1 Tax=Ajellomyces capsulatus TaxID=5037 RepID=A0A8H8D0U9_AJECA|nr:hypothetical protein I7I52_06160 [Histoplasma capsulatum]QSS73754.1 hypothetical protein I7I50_08645 [Histoplasma capsulatum G186AR]